MSAIPARPEGGRFFQIRKRCGQSRQRGEKNGALRTADFAQQAVQIPKRILGEQDVPRLGQVELDAAPVGRRSAPRDQAAPLERLDNLRGRAARRCLETGKGRGRAGAGIGPREKPQAGPLHRRETGLRVIPSGSTPEMDEQFRDVVDGIELV